MSKALATTNAPVVTVRDQMGRGPFDPNPSR